MKRFLAVGATLLTLTLTGCASGNTDAAELCSELEPKLAAVMEPWAGVKTGESAAQLEERTEGSRDALQEVPSAGGATDDYVAAAGAWLDAGEEVRQGQGSSEQMSAAMEDMLAAQAELMVDCALGE